ncbi:hypothetical protein BKK79_00785 [Cupriavidus sp. USMAA2-4]|uniref:hypothetical protein n=1 Tax=Cupriavidus sp. USMAA2-4 TaxID=876364 RepID=UPI0008A6B082|nr:hypothetical protein [Cupriavidus sp. USMAA2-4]AOY90524.1 hypothetical protein BKK79_00785 [Cupriavidus sp. USMAA2-4]
MTTLTIVHNGTSLQISGTYCRGYGDSHDEPGQDACFEVERITDSGVDVTHLHDMDEISDLALDAYLADAAFEAGQAADLKRDEVLA